ncbi:MAG: DNA gyrase subunit A [Planctomycetes bacterium]|nr:DNA gyrase subunit A [Planctomycetota bacterium]
MSEDNQQATLGRGIIDWPIEDELKNSYLTYSMSVIVSRAIPDVRDGLKPVQRRIITAMNDLKLRHSSKHRKCAKVVGETMGNYHPHGDAALYDTLVRMAQDFSMRYQLVDGQGNFGSIDGDPAAAQRYTECRMQRITDELLLDIEKDTVDFQDNYDGTTQEPSILPGKIPNLLLNGATGIAVGMATNIPPHNLKEVCNGIIALLDNPDISIKELIKDHIKGPDFPTGGLICGRDGIYKAFTTGKGSIITRARCHIESHKNGKRQCVIVTEIPYMTNKATIITKIASLVKEGQIDGISNIHDYSNRNGIKISIEVKQNEDPNVVLNQLYKRTPLQSTFSVNTIALVNGRPETLNIKEILEHYRDHRIDVIRRRTLFLLNKAEARAHILEGLLKALDNIDRVIEIIRGSQEVSEARDKLMSEFALSHVQAQAILDMRLARLTGLQRKEIEEEYAELQIKIADYKAILADRALVLDIIREDCYELIDRYGDDRRSEIVAAAEDITVEDLIAEEEMVVVVSHEGYIKRMSIDSYRKQGRGGKGVTGMGNMKDGDFIEHLFIGSTHDYILFFSNLGQVHWLKIYDVPEMGRAAKGRSIANLLQLKPEENISALLAVREFDDSHYIIMATKQGVIKKTILSAFSRPMKGGIKALNIKDGDELMGVEMTTGEDEIMLASKNGQACRFKESDVRPMGRTAAGVGGMKLVDDDECVGLMVVSPNCTVLTISENGMGKRSSFEDYRLTKRGAKGVVNMKVTEKTGKVVNCMTVDEMDDVMVITHEGMVVRTSVNGIRVIGRATQGVKVIRLKDEDSVVAVAKVVSDKDEDEDSENGDSEGVNYSDSEDNDDKSASAETYDAGSEEE